MKTALIITSYNRYEYYKKCIDSVLAMYEMPDSIYLADDCSTDHNMINTIINLVNDVENVHYIPTDSNCGIRNNLLGTIDTVYNMGYDLIINLDGDAIVKPNFITRMKELKQRFPDSIVSGFNCNHVQNPVLYTGHDYVERKHCNGINMCFYAQQYIDIIRPALMSNGNWDYNSTHNKNFIISKPSVVQHIGLNSSMGHHNVDIACDF